MGLELGFAIRFRAFNFCESSEVPLISKLVMAFKIRFQFWYKKLKKFPTLEHPTSVLILFLDEFTE